MKTDFKDIYIEMIKKSYEVNNEHDEEEFQNLMKDAKEKTQDVFSDELVQGMIVGYCLANYPEVAYTLFNMTTESIVNLAIDAFED